VFRTFITLVTSISKRILIHFERGDRNTMKGSPQHEPQAGRVRLRNKNEGS
jgi:hypothetical protein